MHHAKNYTNKISPLEKRCRAPERPRANLLDPLAYPAINLPQDMKKVAVVATILSGSGSTSRTASIRTPSQEWSDLWVADAAIRYLQDQLAKRDLALDWAINSRLLAWAKEAKARARVEELSSARDNLQVYYNTLNEEVHVLYSQLHPNVPVDPVGMEAIPSRVAGEALDGELDLLGPLPLWSWLTNGLLPPTTTLPKVKGSSLPSARNIGRTGLSY
jgi:hypothetical protein